MNWRLADRTLELGQPIACGIVNVTSDSMFEGARSGTAVQAIEDGRGLVEAGFDMLDVGAVAARSGPPVGDEEEAGALVPAVGGLASLQQLVPHGEAAGYGPSEAHDRTGEVNASGPRDRADEVNASGPRDRADEVGSSGPRDRAGRAGPSTVPVSADTFSAEVARRALGAGAVVVNDISGGSREMFELVAETGCGYVLTHIEGPPRVDRPARDYGDVVEHLKRWFGGRVEAAVGLGVAEEQIAIDPGLDFDMTTEQDLEVLRRLGELTELGLPLYVSLSRKDFIGAVLAGSWDERLPAAEREWGTVAAVALAVRAGADVLRIHDRSSLQAVRVAGRITRRGAGGETLPPPERDTARPARRADG